MALPAFPLLYRKAVLGASIESTYGTAETISSALGALLYDLEISPEDWFSEGMREAHGSHLGQLAAVRGKTTANVRFKHEVRHNDGFITLLRSAGFYNSSGSTYSPGRGISEQPTATVAAWFDGLAGSANGVKKVVAGCVSDLTLTATAGGRVMADWNMRGVWGAPSDDQPVSDSAVTNNTKYMSAASTFTIGAATVPLASEVVIATNNEIEMRPTLLPAAGVLHGVIVRRKPTVTADFDAHLLADFNPFSAMSAGTLAALSLVFSTGSNTLTIGAPNLQVIGIEDGSRNASRITRVTYMCTPTSAGDDELTFAMA